LPSALPWRFCRDASAPCPTSISTFAVTRFPAPAWKPRRAPNPMPTGLITYETYQVVVARRGDTVAQVASRVGLTSAELAASTVRRATDVLRDGEVLALPRRVSPAGGGTDIASIARGAIDEADTRRARRRTAGPAGGGAGAPPGRPGGNRLFHRAALRRVGAVAGRMERARPRPRGAREPVPDHPIVLEASDAPGTQPPGTSIAPPPPSAGDPLPDAIETAPLPPRPVVARPHRRPRPNRSPSPSRTRRRASSGPWRARSCAPSPRPMRASTSRRPPARPCARQATARWPRSPRTPTRCRSW
jgi:lipoprotein NlpD